MMETLLLPLQYGYMQKAILISSLIGFVCALLSCFLILKGWSLMGDALAHAIVPGVALSLMLGIPYAVGGFIAGLLAATLMAYVKNNTRIREDAVIGVVYTTFFAIGLVLISLSPTTINLRSMILGNILGISDLDMWQVIIISAFTLVVIMCKWKDLLLFCFDRSHARSLGLPVNILHITLLTLLSLTAVAALQAVGACLVVAMLITPGATAYLLTDRFDRMMVIASLMGLICSMVGAYLSYFIDVSTGGCIVVLQTLVFLIVFIFAPKYGILVNRMKQKLKVS